MSVDTICSATLVKTLSSGGGITAVGVWGTGIFWYLVWDGRHYGGTGHTGGFEVCDQDEKRDANLSFSQNSQQPLRPSVGVVFHPHSEAEGHSHAQKTLMLTTV